MRASGSICRLMLVILATMIPVVRSGLNIFSQTREKPGTNLRQPTPYDRISRALDSGEIGLKEAVLLKAELLFAPSLIPVGSKFAPNPDETLAQEDCLTGFYKDVHRAFPELNEEELKFLGSLSPELETIIQQREKEEKGSTN